MIELWAKAYFSCLALLQGSIEQGNHKQISSEICEISEIHNESSSAARMVAQHWRQEIGQLHPYTTAGAVVRG